MAEFGGRKWFCEYCKIMVPYTKAKIDDHEKGQKHRQTKERVLMERQMKIMKEKERVFGVFSGNKVSDKPVSLLESNIAQIIAAKDDSEFPVIAPDEEDYEKQEYQDLSKPKAVFEKIWVIKRDEESGKLCFYNRISHQKKFEKPVGLKLSEKERILWEKEQEDVEAGPYYEPTASNNAEVGKWEVVNAEDDFYNRNAYVEPEEGDEDEEDEAMRLPNDKIRKLEEIENRLDAAEIGNAEQFDFIDEVLELRGDGSYGQTSIKIKNERLKTLVEKDIELGISEKPVYKKKREEENEEEKNQEGLVNTDLKFKKRVLNNKKAMKIQLSPDKSD